MQRLALFLGLLIVAILPARANAAEESGPIVKQVGFQTREGQPPSVNEQWLRRQIETQAGRRFSTAIVNEDIKRLYKLNYFDSIDVRTDNVEGGVNVVFSVGERAVVRRIGVEGNTKFKYRSLRDHIQTKVGDYLDRAQLQRDKNSLLDYYYSKSYMKARVDIEAEPFEDGVRVVFRIAEDYKYRIAEINFHGNEAVKSADLLGHMETKAIGWLNTGTLKFDAFERDIERLRAFYQSKGHLDAKVAVKPFPYSRNVPKWFFQKRFFYVDFFVDEGPVYTVGKVKVTIEGGPTFSEEEIRKQIVLKEGEIFNQQQVGDDSRAIQRLYGNKGYRQVKIEPVREFGEGTHVMDIHYKIGEGKPNTIRDIVIKGNKKTKEIVLRRELPFYPGELSNVEKEEKGERKLKNLDYFDNVNITAQPVSDEEVVTEVEVDEKQTGQLMFGVGTSSNERYMGSVGVRQRNFDWRDWPKSWRDLFTGNAFVGGGQRASLDVRAGEKSLDISADFFNPWIFNRPIGMGMGAYYWTRYRDDFSETRLGGYNKYVRQLWIPEFSGFIQERYTRINIFSLDHEAPPQYWREEGWSDLLTTTVGLDYRTIDNPWMPSRGFDAGISADLTYLDRDYYRINTSVAWYKTLFEHKDKSKHVLTLQTKLGYTDGLFDTVDTPFYDKYYGGGLGSIRGFSQRTVSPRVDGVEVGGNAMGVASVEYRFPIYEQYLSGHLFVDYGSADDDPAAVFTSAARGSAGIGFSVLTPLGPQPMVVYFAYPWLMREGDDKQWFQFSFGTRW